MPASQSSFHGASSASTTSSGSKTKASQQAHLLSHATVTAIVAAKSILMSGGTEDVALRTAKAAAVSVLDPVSSDGDTISRRSLGFFGRRKVRRQAEVVASMALVTATSNLQGGVASDWSTSDGIPVSHINPYAKNITTRPMSTADEPSVLSGTTRPPRPPLGISALSQGNNTRRLNENGGCSTRASPPIASTKSELLANHSLGSPRQEEQPTSENVDPIIVPLKSPAKSLFDSPEKPASSSSKTVKEENIGALVPLGNGSELFDDETTVNPASVWTNGRGNASWNDLDPLLNTVSNVFSLLTCSPMGGVDHHPTRSIRGTGIPRRITHRHRDLDTVTTGQDTLDERTDEGTEFNSLDSYDDTQAKGHTVSSSSSGESSIGSSYIHDMHSCSAASEGNIHVRNSLRNKMEQIVSKSRKDYDDDSRWPTYELGDRASRADRDVSTSSPPTGRRLTAHSQKLRVTRVTPRNRKRGFFVAK
jgi:hypothetical protein